MSNEKGKSNYKLNGRWYTYTNQKSRDEKDIKYVFNAVVEGNKWVIFRDGSEVRKYKIDRNNIRDNRIESKLDDQGDLIWNSGTLSRHILYNNSKTFIGNTI